MTSDSDTDTWLCDVMWHWQCHTHGLDTWHFYFFSKIKKNG